MQRAPVGSVNKTPLQCLTATSGSHKTHDQPHTLPAPPLPSPQTFHEPHLRTSPIFTPPAAPAPPAHGTVARRPKRSILVPTRGNRPDVHGKEGERALEAACYLEDLIEFDWRPRHGRTRSRERITSSCPRGTAKRGRTSTWPLRAPGKTATARPHDGRLRLVTAHPAPVPLEPLCQLTVCSFSGKEFF